MINDESQIISDIIKIINKTLDMGAFCVESVEHTD